MPSVTASGGTANVLPPTRRWAWAMIVSTASGTTRVRESRNCSTVTPVQREAGGSLKAMWP